MHLRYPIRLIALSALLSFAKTAGAADAAGVIASVRGQVSIQSVGSGPIRSAELGMRLDPGDAVRVGAGGSAAVYLSGGSGILRLSPGEHLTLPQRTADAANGSRPVPLTPSAIRVSEAGLWVLNDPQGSLLVAAMRGGDESAEDRASGGATPLSPRRETVTSAPAFYATGGSRPVGIAIASGKKIVWRGGSFVGDGPWSIAGLVQLEAGGLYLWRLESVKDAAPLSTWTPFRVGTSEDRDKTKMLEEEIAKLSSSADGTSTADLLRCGYYLQVQGWTPLLAAAQRILAASPDARIGRAAREQALHGLGLDVEGAIALERKLTGGGT